MEYRDREDYFRYLLDYGVVSKVKPLLENVGYKVSNERDGKIRCEMYMAWDYPWHHIAHIREVDCHMWHRVMFDVVGLLPIPCLTCFKVVVRPRTLRQLFALLDLQLALDMPGKCGIEDRPQVFGNYGGYFYNRGIDDGLDCYGAVCDALLSDDLLAPLLDEVGERGETKRVILKRGCTEFEAKFGRSDQWRPMEWQEELERRVNDAFFRDYPKNLQPDHVIEHIHEKWIRFAWDRGDPTAVYYNGGRPLYPPVVTYHHIKREELDDNEEGRQ